MSTQGQGDVVARLRERAAIARGEKTGTALGDAYHFDEAAEEIERLRTLLSSSRGEQGWRTIDSAPKDGSDILAWSPGLMIGAMVLYWADGYWREKANCMGLKADITHWMPLPSAPGSVPTSLAGQVPDGYVLVPKEPTAEMIKAWREVFSPWPYENNAWYALLSAAPQPTAGGDAPVLAERAREIADRWFDSRGQQGGVHHSRAELAEQLVRALSAERARVIALETALRGAIANLEHVSVFDEADDDDQEAIEARSAWQRDLDRFRAALRALSQQDTGGAK